VTTDDVFRRVHGGFIDICEAAISVENRGWMPAGTHSARHTPKSVQGRHI
jgi:hypothetical protein